MTTATAVNTVQDYAAALRSGASATVEGLCGRIIRGKSPNDFLTLTDDPTRKIVMLVDPDGLTQMLGKTGYQMLIEVGYEPDYLDHKVAEGNQFKLVVFPEGGAAQLATWDNTIDMVCAVYPDVAAPIRACRQALKTRSFESIQAEAGFNFLEVEKAGDNDLRFMTYERFVQSVKTLADVRAFLYFSVHLRELYSGDGWTYDAAGRRGVREYIIPNKPIAELGENQIIDINVIIPNTKGYKTMTSATAVKTLDLPDFYETGQTTNPDYQPNAVVIQAAAVEWIRRYGLKPVGGDRKNVQMLIIDDQGDFSFPNGTLYVGGRSGTGAMDAQRRLVEFIYHYLHIITGKTPTLDTHTPYQIFHPIAHVCRDGSHPAPGTLISADEYKAGDYRPNIAMAKQIGADPSWLQKQFIYYCEQLEATGKLKLCIWPYHCLIGSPGHRLSGVVDAARLFHGFARGSFNTPAIKGGNPLTEHYSIFAPEVTTCWDGKPIPGAQKNTQLIKMLLNADVVIIAGEASSHCVATSIQDFLKEIMAQNPELAKKVYILRDCMAPVFIPGALPDGGDLDFTDDAEKALANFQNAGMNVVESTTPIEDWPGIPNLG